jgi:Co/Zn/Cd efflux system component
MEKEESGILKFAVYVLFISFSLQFAGFIISGSLAMLAFSLFVSTEFLFFLMLLSGLKSKRIVNFSLVSSFLILLAGLSVIYFASYRMVFGGTVKGLEMLAFAFVAIVLDVLVTRKSRLLFVLGNKESFFRILRKTLPSLLLFSGSLWIVFTGDVLIDPLFGMVISIIVMLESIVLFRDSAILSLGKTKSETYLFKVSI